MSVTVREPEFDDRDRALLLADYEAERAPRGSHGLLLSETTDPAYQYDWETPLPTMDFAAEALRKTQDAYKKAYPDADMSALLWTVRRRDRDGRRPTRR